MPGVSPVELQVTFIQTAFVTATGVVSQVPGRPAVTFAMPEVVVGIFQKKSLLQIICDAPALLSPVLTLIWAFNIDPVVHKINRKSNFIFMIDKFFFPTL